MHWDRRRLKQKLLSRTLRFARNEVPYYRDRVAPEGTSLADFPILEPSELKSDPAAFLALERFPDFVLLTGGTTGSPGVIVANVEEYDAVLKHTVGLRRGEMLDPSEFEGILLHLVSISHGVPPLTPRGHPLMSLPFTEYGHGAVWEYFLQRGLPVRGKTYPVTSIQGPATGVKLLTAYLMERGFDGARAPVSRITTYGWHLSRHWAKQLEDFWGAEVVSRFGLTEFSFDVPAICPGCGNYHFQSLFAEYLHPVSRIPVESGDAVLTCTSLLPFCRAMPRIRYWSGDLVSIGEPCDLVGGEEGCSFRGRLRDSIVVTEGDSCRTLLGAIDIVEALDPLPEVHVNDRYAQGFYEGAPPGRSPPLRVGMPAFRLEPDPSPVDPKRVLLYVEADLDAAGVQSTGDQLKASILSALARDGRDRPAQLLAHGIELQVEILERGELAARGLSPTRA